MPDILIKFKVQGYEDVVEELRWRVSQPVRELYGDPRSADLSEAQFCDHTFPVPLFDAAGRMTCERLRVICM